jgi:hypothetical protein
MKNVILILSLLTMALVTDAQCVWESNNANTYTERCYGPTGVYETGQCAMSPNGTLAHFCTAWETGGGQNIVSPVLMTGEVQLAINTTGDPFQISDSWQWSYSAPGIQIDYTNDDKLLFLETDSGQVVFKYQYTEPPIVKRL